jgi:lipoprotein signal peptidase
LSASLLIQTIISALAVSAALVLFLRRFAKGRWWLILLVAAILVDQAAKALAVAHPHSFSIYLNGEQGFGGHFALILPATLVGLAAAWRLATFLKEMKYRMSAPAQVACALVAGALISGAIDRLVIGKAVDFIVPAGSPYAYNLGDLFAFIAAGILIGRGFALAGEGLIILSHKHLVTRS